MAALLIWFNRSVITINDMLFAPNEDYIKHNNDDDDYNFFLFL